MRKQRRWIVNGLFLFASILIIMAVIAGVRRQEDEKKIDKIDGFQVFCEGEEVSALFLDEDCLWVGGRDGVKRIDIESGEFIDYVAEDLELIYAAEICRAADGSIWIGHNEGVTVLGSEGGRRDYREPEITGEESIRFCPCDDKMMIGTMQGATVFEKQGGEWESIGQYNKAEGLVSDAVNVLARGGETLWFGSYLDNQPGGISILTQDGWQYLTIEEGLAHPYVNAILPLEDSTLAACGQMMAGGLNVVEMSYGNYQVTDTFGMDDNIPGEKVRWLYKDWDGHLWITTESDGLLLCPDTRLSHPIDGIILKEEQGLSDNEIKKIVESETYYWLAGRYGLTRIDKMAIRTLLEEEDNGR